MGLFAGTPLDRPPHCEVCERLGSECVCPPPQPHRVAPGTQTAKLSVEKRKKGKLVTVIRGLPADGNDLPLLLTTLKDKCGAGGTLAADEIEIQGSQLDKVRTVLEALGYKIKG